MRQTVEKDTEEITNQCREKLFFH